MTVLRDLNNPTEEPTFTSANEVLERLCPVCGEPVWVTIPAGTVESVADLLRGMAVECDACTRRREGEEWARESQRLRRQRLEASGLPRHFHGVDWSACKPDPEHPFSDEALAATRNWARRAAGERDAARKPGLFISGPVGVGKTTLAGAAVWELLLRRDVRFVSVPDLLIRLGAAFGDEDRAKALKVLTGRGALVLDDLDKTPNPSTYVLSHLYTAIDNRYANRAPLFITANLKPRELVAFFCGHDAAPERRAVAEAIVSRIMEHCVVGWIDGPDRRRA
jgi:DNA replication protein DnaC